jgi:mannose-6-phosphate isomerase-like protein (cupin superfamily)
LVGPLLEIARLHTTTDEAFYVVEGTFGFLAGERIFEGGAGAFVFVPKGLEHTYWNEGNTPSKMLITISPPASSATSRSWLRA